MNTKKFNWVAILVAWFVHFNIGYGWYLAFGNITGSLNQPISFIIGQAILSFLYCIGIAWAIQQTESHNVGSILYLVVTLTLFFILPLNAGSLNNIPVLLIDIGYYVIGAIVIGLIVELWKRK